MGRLVAAIVVAIVLLTAGTLLLVNRLTEPGPARAAAPARASEGGSAWAEPVRDTGDLGPPASAPRFPTAPVPAPAEPSTAQAPAAQPEAPAEEEEPRSDRHEQRRATKMRNVNRVGPARSASTDPGAMRPPWAR